MKVIRPNQITPESIISSSLIETEQAWANNVTYPEGSIVYDGLDGVYQAITSNLNKRPTLNPLEWTYLGPTNKWAMFDTQVNTASTGQGNINITIRTGNLQGIALLNVVGNFVNITVRNGYNGTIIYQSEQSLIGEINDWYQYFFFDMENQRNQAIFLDLPMNYIDTYTTIVVSGTNTVSVGACTFGRILDIGDAEYGATSGITDYSIKETDDFGQTTFVKRAYSKRMSARVLVKNSELNRVQRGLYDLRAVPALWFASENPQLEEALIVFGYYRDFSTDISYPSYSYCSLEIEGLI